MHSDGLEMLTTGIGTEWAMFHRTLVGLTEDLLD
jgi:hypothetical protein